MEEFSALEQATIALAEQRASSADKSRLRALGVVHTPLALVRFALTRVERALREDLAQPNGFASNEISVLDPAAGTGVWLASLLARLPLNGTRAPRLLAFERDEQVAEQLRTLLTPAAEAHGAQLLVRSANTLEVELPWQRECARVIVGNPPWGARSLSRGGALSDAWLREFHRTPDGQPLGERRSGVLSDDYVRFFRWALEQARGATHGAVVCLVTNASYLSGPVHRGMRGALVHAFDRIEVVDLGGSALLSGSAEPDQGLFSIRVGAALTLCVRRPGGQLRRALVHSTALRGQRTHKLQLLRQQQLAASIVEPAAPHYSFRERARTASPQEGFSLPEAFPFHAEGVQTNRDALLTDGTRDLLQSRLEALLRGEIALPPSRHLDPERARSSLQRALEGGEEVIGQLCYRPFETRFYCRVAPLCHRARPRLAHALRQSDACLVSVRKEPGASEWNMFGAVGKVADSSFLSTRSSCRTRLFPSHDSEGRPNVAPHVADRLATLHGDVIEPRTLIEYILGVLGAPTYRRQHSAQLRHDYAMIPWPRTRAVFVETAGAGARFADLLRAEAQPWCADSSVQLTIDADMDALVSRKELRWMAPHTLQIAKGAQIGVGEGASLQARVGHHAIVELAYGARGVATIRDVLAACVRAVLWAEAEKQADVAYQAACSV